MCCSYLFSDEFCLSAKKNLDRVSIPFLWQRTHWISSCHIEWSILWPCVLILWVPSMVTGQSEVNVYLAFSITRQNVDITQTSHTKRSWSKYQKNLLKLHSYIKLRIGCMLPAVMYQRIARLTFPTLNQMILADLSLQRTGTNINIRHAKSKLWSFSSDQDNFLHTNSTCTGYPPPPNKYPTTLSSHAATVSMLYCSSIGSHTIKSWWELFWFSKHFFVILKWKILRILS